MLDCKTCPERLMVCIGNTVLAQAHASLDKGTYCQTGQLEVFSTSGWG